MGRLFKRLKDIFKEKEEESSGEETVSFKKTHICGDTPFFSIH
jgi:hypothetical protein